MKLEELTKQLGLDKDPLIQRATRVVKLQTKFLDISAATDEAGVHMYSPVDAYLAGVAFVTELELALEMDGQDTQHLKQVRSELECHTREIMGPSMQARFAEHKARKANLTGTAPNMQPAKA